MALFTNMRRSLHFAEFVFLVLAGSAMALVAPQASSSVQASQAQAAPGALAVGDTRAVSVRGVAVDPSGAVLPGVTVTASREGRELETTLTNGSGEFAFSRLPDGTIDLLLHLDGFEDARTRVTVPVAGTAKPGDEVRVVQRMELRARSEVVTVRADPVIAPPPPTRPVLEPVPSHEQESVCGPAMAEGLVQSSGTIRAPRTETGQGLFAAGDEILIDAGVTNSLRVGQNFVVRRRFETALFFKRGVRVFGEHSSGLLQIVSIDSQTAVAAVVYACDAMMTGDYLVPFVLDASEDTPTPSTVTLENPAHVLFADAGELVGITRRKMVIDRGERQGVRPGQRLTLLRRSKFRGTKPAIVGEAVVLAVRRDSATIRVAWATDVIYFGIDGDWAVPASSSMR